ncbi:hypothetical protein BDR22DRAFT_963781 [Usnea florida]
MASNVALQVVQAGFQKTRYLNPEYNQCNPDPDTFDVQQYYSGVDHGALLMTTRLAILEQLGDLQHLDLVLGEKGIGVRIPKRKFWDFQVPCETRQMGLDQLLYHQTLIRDFPPQL